MLLSLRPHLCLPWPHRIPSWTPGLHALSPHLSVLHSAARRAFWTLGGCQYSLPGSCLTSLAPWLGIQSPLRAGPSCPLRHPFPLSGMPASTLAVREFPLRSGSNVTNFQRFPWLSPLCYHTTSIISTPSPVPVILTSSQHCLLIMPYVHHFMKSSHQLYKEGILLIPI